MLDVVLLGGVSIEAHGQPVTGFRSQTEIALLAYLAYTGQTDNREALADLLWDARSTKQALSNLRTALTRLRKQVGDELVVTRKTVAIAPAVHEGTDAVRLQALLAAAGTEHSRTAVGLTAQALALYKGEFMAGFTLANAPRFDDWLLVEQERLREIVIRGYRQLARWQEQEGAFAAGVDTVRQWAFWDPLDEEAQQVLLRLLVYDGRTSEAIEVYHRYRDRLHAELDISPAPATTDLYQTIQAGTLPPPVLAPTPLHNLPRALTPLFGRGAEINRLMDYLMNPAYPLLSITGLGGIGKTSLALAAGRQLLAVDGHPFKDGIWFVALEEIEDDTLERIKTEVAALIGQAMGLYFHGQSNLWSQVLQHVGSKNQLIILDNVEQFLPSASELIMDLLDAGNNIHLLITSRTTLPLAANVSFPLSGLDFPDQVSPAALENESVRLFAERAARLQNPFPLEEHLADVVAICQFVEGMPLGIELAAASLGRLTVAEIVPAMADNLQALQTKRRDMPARQRTLHAVFDYSWDLLDHNEQILLAQISVFQGGFTRLAAEAMLAKQASRLYRLLEHALVGRNTTGRFRMHPLLRQLAGEKLSHPDMASSAAQARSRHSLYFAQLLRSCEDGLLRGLAQEALQILLPEQANIRAAWQHAVETREWQTIAVCLNSLHHFFMRLGSFVEEAALLDAAIERLQAETAVADAFSTSLLARLLIARAWDLRFMAQFEDGLRTVERATELARGLGEVGLEAQARSIWAQILSTQHNPEQALAHYEQVVELAAIAQDPFLEADGWIGIGEQSAWLNDSARATEALSRALELCQTLQYKPGELETLLLLGNHAAIEGEGDESSRYYERALHLSRLLGDIVQEAEALGTLGVRLAARSDFVRSQAYHEAALAKYHELNMPESEAWVLGELGYTTLQLGDYATAESVLREALAIAVRLNDEFWQGWVKLRLGTVYNEQGEATKALALIQEAHQTAEKLQFMNFKAGVLYEWGNVLLNEADWSAAERKFQEGYDFRYSSARTETALPSLAGLAFATYKQGDAVTAIRHADRLWEIWQEWPAMAERSNLKPYWMLAMVWDGLADDRAAGLWQRARALLLERSAAIPDDNRRTMFLEQVPAHRAILQACQ